MFDSNISIHSEYVNDNVEKTKTEFCIRTDYGKVNTNTSDGIVESSVNLYKVKNTINFVFEIWAFTSCDVTIEEEQAAEAQQASVITSKLEACDYSTDADSNIDFYKIGTSNAKAYNQSDITNVRVNDPNGNAIITSFKDIELRSKNKRSKVTIPPIVIPTLLSFQL